MPQVRAGKTTPQPSQIGAGSGREHCDGPSVGEPGRAGQGPRGGEIDYVRSHKSYILAAAAGRKVGGGGLGEGRSRRARAFGLLGSSSYFVGR